MNRNSLGDQIRDIVETAVDSMDFSQLNQQIRRTVNGALDEVRNAVGPYQSPNSKNNNFHQGQNWQDPNQQRWNANNQQANPNQQRWNGNQQQANANQQRWNANQNWQRSDPRWGNPHQGPGNNQNYPRYENRSQVQRSQAMAPQKVNGNKKPFKKVSGILCTVFGGIGTGLFGLGALTTSVIASFNGIFTVLGPISAVLSVLFVGSVVLLLRGISIRGMGKRYHDYVRALKGSTFCSIEEMAHFVGKSKRYVISDLRKMIQLGMFPEGHIDQNKTNFIATDETFKQYLSSVKSYEERRKQEELEAKEKKWTRNAKKQNISQDLEDEQKKADHTQSVDEDSELYRTIKTGRAYIIEIRQANDKIPGEEISRKLDRLEEVTTKIFICVENHPEQLSEIRRFMEYYLPTTLKLVNAYREFDSQIVQGENITSAKREIENTLDTINDAFERLLDGLFQDAAMEVSADISVLNTLLAQEGLTKRDFN